MNRTKRLVANANPPGESEGAMAMKKRDIELEEYLRDAEIQFALRQLQHRNRPRRHTGATRDRRYAARRTYRPDGLTRAKNE